LRCSVRGSPAPTTLVYFRTCTYRIDTPRRECAVKTHQYPFLLCMIRCPTSEGRPGWASHDGCPPLYAGTERNCSRLPQTLMTLVFVQKHNRIPRSGRVSNLHPPARPLLPPFRLHPKPYQSPLPDRRPTTTNEREGIRIGFRPSNPPSNVSIQVPETHRPSRISSRSAPATIQSPTHRKTHGTLPASLAKALSPCQQGPTHHPRETYPTAPVSTLA
jgi:hypothetical protein